MSLLTDILKEVPLSTVLKEKLSTLETEIASLKTENAILKDDLRELKRENQILKDEINRATHSFDLDDTMKHILLILAQQDDALSKNSLADLLQICESVVENEQKESDCKFSPAMNHQRVS